ncbi:MAG: peptidylprolyl isomerase [Clostridia bacterium]|nr:peptidylprolyl isomerase [Clostridia bacterium]
MSKKSSYAAQQRKAEKQKKTVIYSIAAVLCVAVLVGVIVRISSCSSGIKYVEADPNLTYYADIDIKDYGMITVKLDQSAAPKTVGNFISLAQSGFYDGLTFHRIMKGFMMQGGDPEGNGTGGAEKTVVGEFSANGHNNPISHKRGVISMARANDPNSASSQFFIVHEDSEDSLDGKYAAFGHVISGMEVVDKICETVPQGYNGAVAEADKPVINSIIIRTEPKN